MLAMSNAIDGLPAHLSYPAQSKTTTAIVGGNQTSATTTNFSDKIVTTISQDGKTGQWFQVALQPRDPSIYAGIQQLDAGLEDDSALLPLSHLSAHTLLGASTPDRETMGQLYATHIASSIMAKRPDESRIFLLGLGLKPTAEIDREQFFGLLELAMQTI